ncbi:MAG: OHCU decarboxylase [Proteobacteria bacterium]|nr:MAG: OHCU decarboxylase [Pseudomonadota bacterium]
MSTTIAELNRLDRAAFARSLGHIYEHSPWVGERAWSARPFASIQALWSAMQQVVERAGNDEQLALIRAHPELAGKLAIAQQLTTDSRVEQAGAGLDRCTPEEFAQFQALNKAYREKFGFPFIVAVRGLDRSTILERMRQRVNHSTEQEFATCLREIGRIARFRLDDLIEEHEVSSNHRSQTHG